MFLPDVDGLINGSPVKLMGIQIGYVNQIDIVGDDVYVKFIVTESKTRIPKGSKATVEFLGLGGSKSLEIYPPTKTDIPSEKFLIPQKPKRIHDSLGLLNKMFEEVVKMTYDISHFMDELGFIRQNTNSQNKGAITKSADEMLNYSNDWLDRAHIQTKKFDSKLNGGNRKNDSRKEYGKRDSQNE